MLQIKIGQWLLVICCIFYLIWWSIAFHPNHGDDHTSGLDGWLLLITALFGLAGIAINLIGIRDSGAGKGFTNGAMIAVVGVIVYIVLLIGTRLIFHRQVTTELLLIVGWTMLEISSVNVAFALEAVSWEKVVAILVIVVIAAVASFICYMLYYNVAPMTGYFFGMIPLITEAVSMVVFEVILIQHG